MTASAWHAVSIILCIVAIALWVMAALGKRLKFGPTVELGWLGLAVWAISLLVR